MTNLHFEDALNFLIEQLATIPVAAAGQARARQGRAQGSDIWIDDVCNQYWRLRGHTVADMAQDDKEPYIAPFYDAAWDLARRGVLRPAASVPGGQKGANQLGQLVYASPLLWRRIFSDRLGPEEGAKDQVRTNKDALRPCSDDGGPAPVQIASWRRVRSTRGGGCGGLAFWKLSFRMYDGRCCRRIHSDRHRDCEE